MNGPISIITIDSETPAPKKYEYTLTLTFKAHTWDVPADSDITEQIENVFRAWRDGRYPFHVEMVQNGIDEIVKTALYNCCLKRASQKHGSKMIETRPGSKTSCAYIEAQKEYDAITKVHNAGRLWLNEEPKVEIMEEKK